jgi:hypothetical protein
MGVSGVKEAFHAFLYLSQHTLEPGMIQPVLGRVFSQGPSIQVIATDTFIQVK